MKFLILRSYLKLKQILYWIDLNNTEKQIWGNKDYNLYHLKQTFKASSSFMLLLLCQMCKISELYHSTYFI